MADHKDQFPTLYYPESAEELLTEPTLRMLMLGFTAGLERMPLALQDRKKRYDLHGNPIEYWSNFCRTLRRIYECENTCLKWDEKVAKVLLGDMPEEYQGQADKFKKPFTCHAGMIDMAKIIFVGGRRFAVLHGGQIPPRQSAWKDNMQRSLGKLLKGQTEKVNHLIDCVKQDIQNKPQPINIEEYHERFCKFAEQIEDLLNKLFRERRSAAEEVLLKALKDAIIQSKDENWWEDFVQLFTPLTRALRLERMAFLIGTSYSRAGLQLNVAHSNNWLRDLMIIPWNEVQRYSKYETDSITNEIIRTRFLLKNNKDFELVATSCQTGSPSRNFPAFLLCVGKEVLVPGMRDFIHRLTEEMAQSISRIANIVELRKMRNDWAEFGAYTGHGIKFPLHAALNISEAIGYQLRDLNVNDLALHKNLNKLIEALKETRIRAAALEELPIKEITIECELKRMDVIPLVDRTIEMAKNTEPDKRIAVNWIERPSEPIMLDIDKEYFTTALEAIVENAVKYSFKHKEVRVFAQIVDNYFVLEVNNYGIGIPPWQLLDIFDFGRRGQVEDAYRKRTGNGLGLPFARRIVAAHYGSVDLRSIPLKDVTPEKDDYHNHLVIASIRLPLPK